MIIIFKTILFGILQGITEFVPVSSSGHLAILHNFISLEGVIDNLSFDVALHMGTLVALCIYFYKDIIKYIVGAYHWITQGKRETIEQKMALWLIVGTIPAVVMGVVGEACITRYLSSIISVSVMLVIIGIFMIITERIAKQKYTMKKITWRIALCIGILQAIALIPGVSRSGITIIAGMWANLKRSTAAQFSFLLGIPAIFGAGLKKTYDIFQTGEQVEWNLFAIGLITSAIVGYLVVRWLLQYLKKHRLDVFAYYIIILGIAMLALEFFT